MKHWKKLGGHSRAPRTVHTSPAVPGAFTIFTVQCFINKIFRLKSQKEFLIKFDSEPERAQWYRDLVRTWQEAQKLLKRGPKQISAQRSVKEEAKQKGAIILAQKSQKLTGNL